MKTPTDNKTLWARVLARDARADGSFVYAVRTTGIYCRPSCPSRRPHASSVEFFAAPGAAEHAGYRACKRCTPDQLDRQRSAVIAVCKHIAAHADESLTLAQLGVHAGMSPSHLQRLFKHIVGVSPREYQETCRLDAFKRHARGGASVADATYAAGFGSSSRLYEKSTQLGMTPARYQKRGATLEIGYTTFDSPLGQVLIAATARGLCKISLGKNARTLERELRAEFGAAACRPDEQALHSYRERLTRYLTGSNPDLALPLDIRATAFQRRVWRILQSIPYGATRSYSEIAVKAGTPTAVRAVARAIATNPVALVIPCHRAIRKNGAMAGYRWGVERKRALLTRESGADFKTKLQRSKKISR